MNFDNLGIDFSNFSGYTWRAMTLEDAQGINRLLLDIEAVDQRGWVDTLEERQRDFQDPATNIQTDSIVAVTNQDQIAALGWVFAPKQSNDQEYVAFLWGEVHPSHRQRGLGTMILSWMEQRGRQILSNRPADLPHYLRSWSQEKLIDRVLLLENNAFIPTRYFYRMRRSLDQPIPPVSLPNDIYLITWDVDKDEAARQVFNESFKDHWGFIPATQEEWGLFLAGHEDFRPDLSFMALAKRAGGESEVIAISLNKIDAAQNQLYAIQEAWIQDLAVLRPYRKRGIATALLCASMQAFKDAGFQYAGLGVDTENLTGALSIYEKIGFEPIRRNITFQKQV